MPEAPLVTFSGRPTIRIAGQALPLLSANIARMVVRERLGGLSSLELALVDALAFGDGSAGYGATAGSPLKLGVEIGVYAGDTTAPQEIFQGTVTAIEAEAGPHSAPLFTLLAEDRLWKARRKRQARSFQQSSPADLVRRIAGDHGLRPEVGDGLDTPIADWVQLNESDLAFLRRVLARFDADLQVVDDRLQAGKRASVARSTLTLAMGNQLLRARITADLNDIASEVRVSGFDPATGEAATGTATSGTLGPGQGQTGAALLQPLLDPVREHVGVEGMLTDGEARQLAEALFGERARRFVRIDGTAQGDASLRVGSHVTITGVNAFFANTYCVTEARHCFDLERGYLTEFQAECAYLGAGP